MRGVNSRIPVAVACLALASMAVGPVAAAPPAASPSWVTVVNNQHVMPGSDSLFNAYNQPSVNEDGLVVFRARAKGGTGTEPPHGIYLRDLSTDQGTRGVVDRTTLVPAPNNQGATFTEYPAFPRIDASSRSFAFRGNTQPVWRLGEDELDIAGTTGIFADVGGLVTGASKLGAVPGFEVYGVPGVEPVVGFEVFPGAPSLARNRIVFKGNYTEDGIARTGVFARDLEAVDLGGSAPTRAIATSGDTVIPGSETLFGSLATPSAAGRLAAFAGYDDEAAPSLGGIYLASTQGAPRLRALVSIGDAVPDRSGAPTSERFTSFGEAVSFNGQYAAFWGAWGTEMRTVVVACPTEGNKARRQLCIDMSPGRLGYVERLVPEHQGVFVHDLGSGQTFMTAQTDDSFLDFVSWGFTGKVPGSPEGDDGEPAMWRSSSYVAVSGTGRSFWVAFRAETQDGHAGVYLAEGPDARMDGFETLVETGMPGSVLDPVAAPPDSKVTEVGIERDGFRGTWLVVNAKMLVPGAGEDAGMAGIYATRVRLTGGR